MFAALMGDGSGRLQAHLLNKTQECSQVKEHFFLKKNQIHEKVLGNCRVIFMINETVNTSEHDRTHPKLQFFLLHGPPLSKEGKNKNKNKCSMHLSFFPLEKETHIPCGNGIIPAS